MSMGRQLAKHEMVFPYHSRPAKQERRPSENGETKDLVDGVCFQGRNPLAWTTYISMFIKTSRERHP